MNSHDEQEVASHNECLTFNDIENAYRRISNYIHETPVLTCSSLNRIASANCQQNLHLYFKCENFQKTGSFKVPYKISFDKVIVFAQYFIISCYNFSFFHFVLGKRSNECYP